MRKRLRRGMAMVALGCLSCGKGPFAGPAPARPDPPGAIVLISIDTLRADRLPAYGYRGVDTPAIDALAAEGVVVRRAYTHTPLTVPAHVSMLSGLLPGAHGVRDNVGYPFDAAASPSLARELRGLGYATGGFVSVLLLAGEDGFGEGFDVYDSQVDTAATFGAAGLQRPGAATLKRATDWIDTLGGRPFFLFLHLYEPHSPYRPPPPYASRYPDPYDGEVAAADAVVGELLAFLEERGLDDETAVLLLADHGEGLGQHGEREHGVLLYDESLRIPMILRLPRRERADCEEIAPVAQLVDVFPTLVELGGGTPPPEVPGMSLLDLCRSPTLARQIHAETFYPRLHFGWSDLATLIDYPYQYIRGPEPELYDLEHDPLQVEDLARRLPEVARRLHRDLARLDSDFAPPTGPSPEQRQALAALGYVGVAGDLDATDLPDPRRQLPTTAALDRGLEALTRGDLDVAVRELRAMTEANPRLVDAWGYLGVALSRAGRLDAAAEATREALRLLPTWTPAAIQLAKILVATGRHDEAATFLRRQLVLTPGEIRLRLLESYALLHAGRIDEAREVAETTVLAAPRDADAFFQRGSVAIAQGRLDQAEDDLRRALELAPDHGAATSDLALLLEHRGEVAAAREVLRHGLELDPGNVELARREAALAAAHPGASAPSASQQATADRDLRR